MSIKIYAQRVDPQVVDFLRIRYSDSISKCSWKVRGIYITFLLIYSNVPQQGCNCTKAEGRKVEREISYRDWSEEDTGYRRNTMGQALSLFCTQTYCDVGEEIMVDGRMAGLVG